MTSNIRACLGLECEHSSRRNASAKMSSSHKLSRQEMKLLEGCQWLIAAGFPQYIQLYKDDRFPISLRTVESDHDFLDKDCLKALTRRLATLNKLSESSVQLPKNKQQSLQPGITGFPTSEVYALSNRWRFDQLSQQWLWTSSPSSSHQPLHVQTNLSSIPPGADSSSTFPSSSLEQLTDLSCGGLTVEGEDLSPGGEETRMDRGSEEVTSARLTSGYASESSPQSSASRHSRTDSGGGAAEAGEEERGSDGSSSPVARRRVNHGGSLSSAGSDTLFDDVPASPNPRRESSISNEPTLLSSTQSHRSSTSTSHSGHSSRCGSVVTKCDNDESISWTDLLKRRVEQHNKKCETDEDKILIDENEDPPLGLKRHSFYDNLSPTELKSMTPDVQKELDSILSDLYYNIGNINPENKPNIPAQSAPRNGSVSEMCRRKKCVTLPAGRAISVSDQFTSSQLPSSSAGYSRHFSVDVSMSHHRDLTGNISGGKDWRNGLTQSRQSRHSPREGGGGGGGEEEEVGRGRGPAPPWGLTPNGDSEENDDDYPATSPTDWNKCHSPDGCTESLQLSRLYAKQLTALKKLSLLQLTALFDKHCKEFDLDAIVSQQRSLSSQVKSFSESGNGRKIFGVPLQSILERNFTSIPHSICLAVDYLRKVGLDSMGLFRKSGIQSRIQKLQNDMDQDAPLDFSSVDVYDVADALKRYFRELRECLLTASISSLFLTIFISVPEELRGVAVRRAVILLPEANRLSLQFLLEFLYDVTEQSGENQMTASNLAVCFLPSLFCVPNLSGAGGSGNTAEPVKRAESKSEVPWDYKAALACVTHLISHAKQIFTVPEDSWSVVRMSSYTCNQELRQLIGHVERGITRSHITSYIQFCLDMSLTEHSDWLLLNTRDRDVTLCVKDVHDNECLRTWRCISEVPAEPSRVLQRLRKERHLWCGGLVRWHVVERIGDNCDVFYSVINIPSYKQTQPTEFCEFRCWRSDLPRGACALVSATADRHALVHEECTSRGSVLASHAYIEQCRPGVSRLVLVSRVDLRGHSVDWYTAVYGKLLVEDMIRLRESFQ